MSEIRKSRPRWWESKESAICVVRMVMSRWWRMSGLCQIWFHDRVSCWWREGDYWVYVERPSTGERSKEEATFDIIDLSMAVAIVASQDQLTEANGAHRGSITIYVVSYGYAQTYRGLSRWLHSDRMNEHRSDQENSTWVGGRFESVIEMSRAKSCRTEARGYVIDVGCACYKCSWGYGWKEKNGERWCSLVCGLWYGLSTRKEIFMNEVRVPPDQERGKSR